MPSSRGPFHARGTVLLVLVLVSLSAAPPVSAVSPAARLAPDPNAPQASAVDPDLMTPEQQAGLARRLAAWDALPLAQRTEARACYRAWRALDESERARLRAAAAELDAIDPAQRAALRAQFDALDAAQRRGWRLGPTLGADFAGLSPLIAFVPAAQREPLLAMLRAMPASQRADLARLVQRTPPPQRDALRRALLQLSPAQRGPWLRQRLAE